MKSIKPGRGPSAMNFAGSIVMIIFGILWTIIAASIASNSPFPIVDIIFPLFGIVFIIFGIINAVFNYKNATGQERMSLIDIVNEEEEGDPLNHRFGKKNDKRFCPYCGTKLNDHFRFCPSCGNEIHNSSDL